MFPAPFDTFPVIFLAKEDPARCGLSYSAILAAEHIESAAEKLLEAGYHLEDIGGLDAVEGGVVVYHFSHFSIPGRLALRVIIPHEKPHVPSIAAVYPGAEWHERETKDFFGYTFTNIPSDNPLLVDSTMTHILPLHKPEDKRKPLRILLSTKNMEILYCDTDFTIMNTPDETKAEQQPDTEG